MGGWSDYRLPHEIMLKKSVLMPCSTEWKSNRETHLFFTQKVANWPPFVVSDQIFVTKNQRPELLLRSSSKGVRR